MVQTEIFSGTAFFKGSNRLPRSKPSLSQLHFPDSCVDWRKFVAPHWCRTGVPLSSDTSALTTWLSSSPLTGMTATAATEYPP